MFVFDDIVSGSRPGIIDIDYIIVPVIASAIGKSGRSSMALIASIAVMFIVISADILSTLTQIYFAGPAVILDYLPFISLWPWRWIMVIALVTAAASTLLVMGLMGRTLRLGGVLTAAIPLIVTLFVADRLAQDFDSRAPNIVASATIEIFHPSIAQVVDEWRNKTARLRPETLPTMASIVAADPHPPSRILSVAVESWGQLRNPRADAAMIEPLLSILHDRYAIVQDGPHRFYGATLAGEVRELCGLIQTGGVPHGDDQYRQLRHCLPAKLAERGYRTIAFHGNAGSFYRRTRFYPMMGFMEHRHYEQMRPNVASLCSYLFVGICDRDAARIAVAALDRDRRTFVHLMTLDTHLPLPSATGICLSDPDPEFCTYRRSIARTLQAIATAVQESSHPPDMIFLYGDHAPPFIDRNLRDRFVKEQVPFIALRRIP